MGSQGFLSAASPTAKAASDTMQVTPGSSKEHLYPRSSTEGLMVFRKPFLTTCETQHHCGGTGSLISLRLFWFGSDLYLVADSGTWFLPSQGVSAWEEGDA